jgi:hypothetical protein
MAPRNAGYWPVSGLSGASLIFAVACFESVTRITAAARVLLNLLNRTMRMVPPSNQGDEHECAEKRAERMWIDD